MTKMKLDTKNEIRHYLISIGYKESSRSKNILLKEFTINNPDSSPDAPAEITVIRKYKFMVRNLVKITDGFKNYSIPYSKLAVVDGQITKIKE